MLPKILAVETSGKILSAAFWAGDALVSELSFDLGHKNSQILKEACDFILKQSGCPKEELTHFAVSTGPGSFTGLRVGITFAKTAAQFLKIGAIGIPTFEVIAAGLCQRREWPAVVLIDSIGSDLFCGFFESGELNPKGSYKITSIEQLTKRVKNPMLFAGDGFLRHEIEIRKKLGSKVLAVSAQEHFPHAKNLAAIASQRIRKSAQKFGWEKLLPFYLREPIPVERLKGMKK